jgi:tetratricopeptide (TPR) repeat protein
VRRTIVILCVLATLGVGIALGVRSRNTIEVGTIPELAPGVEVDPMVRESINATILRLRSEMSSAAAWIRLATVYDANGQESLAGLAYDQALKLDDTPAKWWYWLALNQEVRREDEDALHSLEEALNRDPSYVPGLRQRGLWMLQAGRFDEARDAMEDAVRRAPGDISNSVALARVQIELGEVQAAADRLTEVVTRAHDYAYARLLLGTALRRLGRHEEAEVQLNLAEGAVPSYQDPWRDELLQFRSGYHGVIDNTDHLVAAGRTQEALSKLQALRPLYPDDVVLLNKLSETLVRAGRAPEAKRLLLQAVEIEPEHVLTHLKLSNIYFAEGNPSQALAEAQLAARLSPQYGTAHRQVGRLLTHQQDYAGAIDAFLLAMKYGRQEPDIALSLGSLFAQTQRWPEAYETFTDLVLRTPQSADAWYWLALAAGETADFPTAANAFTRAREIEPGHRRAQPISQRLQQIYQEHQRALLRSDGL